MFDAVVLIGATKSIGWLAFIEMRNEDIAWSTGGTEVDGNTIIEGGIEDKARCTFFIDCIFSGDKDRIEGFIFRYGCDIGSDDCFILID